MANTTNRTTRIKHVFGNVLKLAIPLTLRTVTLEGGIVEVTDTDYTPSNHYPVVVQFVNGPLKYELDATIRDNYIAVVEDKGTIPVGNYAIVVLCKDDNGDPRRFKQRCVLEVVDVTADAGIEVGIEFEAQEWLLDGAIFLAIKGEDGIDGVGIESITTDETSVSGEYNQVTFHLTNGSSYTLNVRNGESTEQTLPANVVVDENYVHTDNNYTDTDKQKIESVDKLFADAEYDRISRRLNFFKHGDTMHTNPLKSIDITDFVRDSRVSSFRIIDGNLTIRLNSDGDNEEFKVPISSIFNPNNYYTKEQTDAKLSQKVNLDATTGRVDASQATRVVLDYIVGIYDGEDEPSHDVNAGDVWYDNGQIYYAYNNDVIVVIISLGAPQKDIIYCNAENNKLYRWNGSGFILVGGGNSEGGYEPPVGGIPKTDLASDVQSSLGKADTALQSSDLDGYATTDDVDDAVAALVSSAPQTLDTLKELADALGDDPNFATTMATQLGNKVDKETGKGLSTNDYTTAEKNKLAGLENYDDSALQTAIDGKVDKESGKSLMTDAEHTKLAGIAAGAEVNVQPNWTQTNTSADDYIKNKPTLATVATSGSYNDLQDKPNIPVGVTVDQEITQNGTNPVKGGAIYDALENTKTFIVNVTIDYVNDTITADKTHTEINAAISGGRVVEVINERNIYLLAAVSPIGNQFYFVYSSPEDSSRYVLSVTKRDVWAREEMFIATTGLLQNYVPITRKINSKPLIGDLELTASDVGALPSTTVIPAAQIQSDWEQTTTTEVDYIKNKPDLSTFATNSEVNAKQDTINDLDAIRSGAALGATALQSFTETDPTVPSWAKQQTKPTYTAQEVGALPASTTIPTKVSDLTNDSGFITSYTETDPTVPAWAKSATKPSYTASEISGLATVATSGSYDDLSDKPTIPAAQVNSDWNATSGVSRILNKPTIPTVPTNVSSFTNDAGYLTQHQSLANYYTKSEIDTKIGNIETLLASI